ncbi:DUF2141 domain-containing protein [Sphingomonas xinjiangensis]|uniref:Uncharacterized protein (DUF2141 family) n=1 Tax=Sphingomonas xinjiangensis TaxID=643568 RepID=A0A840YDD5_9SPHN|nr:DUF2141 domain-containing protein [Sphingomonas xinjiangensis]MBB5711407.1 uncharacterized protein (DUF2141 family) [Sphingomonas xinjiangensis]
MSRFPLFAALGLAACALPAAASAQDWMDGSCAAGAGPRLYVNVDGLKDRTGLLKLEIYPANEADFLKDDRDLKKEGKPFRRVWSSMPSAGTVKLCIRAPSAGQWAVLFTHDRDGKNKFNFWQDGAGFPSNQRLGRSRPKLRQALVNVPASGGQITIHAQYLKGLGGFGPL